ncbi:MAG: hypothetical protein R3B45_04555 [Bdellovibrionota bacterium]
MSNTSLPKKQHETPFSEESLVFVDQKTWIWEFVQRTLNKIPNFDFLRLPSYTPIRASWQRFQAAPKIIVHWEDKMRPGGAIIEEINDIDPYFDVSERIIVLSTNPTREDVVYFSELKINKVLQLRNIDKMLKSTEKELIEYISTPVNENNIERRWYKLLNAIDGLKISFNKNEYNNLVNTLEELNNQNTDKTTARYLEAKACLMEFSEEKGKSRKLLELALEKNPNYYRAYNSLINNLRTNSHTEEALSLMKKMQEFNKSSVSRLTAMGEVYLEIDDDEKAEHYFTSALTRDLYSPKALNGMAEIRFRQDSLDDSRKFLARSQKADSIAKKFNLMGIELVKEKKYAEALEHYVKAQYVLPQQEKGPLLFYNIALCYYRWGNTELACDYIKIALIKDPEYQKAKNLLKSIQEEKLPA